MVVEDRAERERRGCECCGEWFPGFMLEWHHVEGRKPGDGTPFKMQNRDLMLAEWLKCIVLCPTCHKIADYERNFHA